MRESRGERTSRRRREEKSCYDCCIRIFYGQGATWGLIFQVGRGCGCKSCCLRYLYSPLYRYRNVQLVHPRIYSCLGRRNIADSPSRSAEQASRTTEREREKESHSVCLRHTSQRASLKNVWTGSKKVYNLHAIVYAWAGDNTGILPRVATVFRRVISCACFLRTGILTLESLAEGNLYTRGYISTVVFLFMKKENATGNNHRLGLIDSTLECSSEREREREGERIRFSPLRFHYFLLSSKSTSATSAVLVSRWPDGSETFFSPRR